MKIIVMLKILWFIIIEPLTIRGLNLRIDENHYW